jgi:hypothetical protein
MDLADLIKVQMQARSLTTKDVARIARRKDHKLVAQQVEECLVEPLETVPHPDVLRALAGGLDLDVRSLADAALESVGCPALGDLIKWRWGGYGIGLRDMSRRAEEAGYTVAVQTLSRYVKLPYVTDPPKADTVRGIAAALEVSVRVVAQAGLHSIGLLAKDDTPCVCTSRPNDHLIVVSSDDRSPEEVAAIVKAAEQAIAREQAKLDRLAHRLPTIDA